MSLAQLRPLDFGEVLDRAFALYRHHFVTLFLTALIPLIPVSLLSGGFARNAVMMDPEVVDPAIFAWMIPLFLVGSVGTVILFAALTQQLSQAFTGGEVSLADGYRRGFRAFFPLLGAGILAYIAIFAAVMAVSMVVGIVAAVALPAGGVVAGIVATVLGIGFFVLTFAALATLFAVVPAVVVERRGPLDALRRSWQLASGARLRIVGVLFVAWLIMMLPMVGVMFIAGMGTAMFDPAAAATLSTGQFFFQQIVGFLSSALILPFFVGCMVLLYYDRRIRTEAYDLEMAAEGLATAH